MEDVSNYKRALQSMDKAWPVNMLYRLDELEEKQDYDCGLKISYHACTGRGVYTTRDFQMGEVYWNVLGNGFQLKHWWI